MDHVIEINTLLLDMRQLLKASPHIEIVGEPEDFSPERITLSEGERIITEDRRVYHMEDDIRLRATITLINDPGMTYLLVLSKSIMSPIWRCYTVRKPETAPRFALSKPEGRYFTSKRMGMMRNMHNLTVTPRKMAEPKLKFAYMVHSRDPRELVYGFTRLVTPDATQMRFRKSGSELPAVA